MDKGFELMARKLSKIDIRTTMQDNVQKIDKELQKYFLIAQKFKMTQRRAAYGLMGLHNVVTFILNNKYILSTCTDQPKKEILIELLEISELFFNQLKEKSIDGKDCLTHLLFEESPLTSLFSIFIEFKLGENIVQD